MRASDAGFRNEVRIKNAGSSPAKSRYNQARLILRAKSGPDNKSGLFADGHFCTKTNGRRSSQTGEEFTSGEEKCGKASVLRPARFNRRAATLRMVMALNLLQVLQD